MVTVLFATDFNYFDLTHKQFICFGILPMICIVKLLINDLQVSIKHQDIE